MADPRYFRFDAFADAASAQAAFEAVYPAGTPAQAALQRLVDMGAQCKSIGPKAIACRYVETRDRLAGFAWQLELRLAEDRTIGGVRLSLALLGA